MTPTELGLPALRDRDSGGPRTAAPRDPARPADPRLEVRLVGFRRQVARIIRRGGGRPRGSELLDGVFFSSILGVTTFQRSREFDVESVTRRELREIADTVRRR